MGSISTVLLDLDDTIYSYREPHRMGLQALLELASTTWEVSAEDAEQLYMESRKQINEELTGYAASHHRLLYAQRMCEKAGRSPFPFATELEEVYWRTFLNLMVPNPGVMEFLSSLKEKEIPVIIVTDLVASIQYRKIAKLSIGPYINFLVTSEEAGREKPHPSIFELALKKGGSEPGEAVMIGDNYDKDILGAMKMGIQPIWYSSEEPKDPGVSAIGSFHQLLHREGFL